MTCDFCGAPISDRTRGGRRVRFCGPACKDGFHRGIRRLGQDLYDAGHITRESIQRAAAATYTEDVRVSEAAE